MGLDLGRMAATAADAFLDGERPADARDERRHRLGGASALALGAVLGIAARTAYRRARDVDLTRVAGAIERRLSG